ncbi:ankycorbin [Rhipicephalus sanguineus]|uniref:ankycorbin n=1 Tax=Rhipicephalus sanguineus TaxID=34632 RepID=UPI0020C3C966|nr:ankycorbin [Rhipicephalus sanguineus]
MKKFFQKKILKSSSAKKQSAASLSSQDGHTDEFYGYSIDLARTDSSFTKLHKACWLGDEDRARSAAKKVDVSFQDNESRSPLHLAAARGHVTIVQLLLRAQARVDALDSEGKTPLMKAVEGHHLEAARCLLEQRANPDVPDQNLDTALHLALSTGQADMAALLVQFDADVSARNKEGMSPLYLAAVQQHLDVARLLLDRGAQANAGDNKKKSPLMVASEAGSVALVQLLLSRGANANAVDDEGRTALDLARRAGHEECAKLLATKTSSAHGGEAESADIESWKSSSDSEASRKGKRLPYNIVIPSPSHLSPQHSITGHSPSPNHLGIKEHPKPYVSSVVINSSMPQKSATNGEPTGTQVGATKSHGLERDGEKNGNIITIPMKEATPKKTPTKPHFEENDIPSWMEGDVSFDESEGDAKATSLYVPSSVSQQKRNSKAEPELHKSVEVLLAYDGQQLRKNTGMEPDETLVKELLEEVPEPSKAPAADKLSVPSDSDWDSTEEVEDLPPNKVMEGTLGRLDTLQGTEEIWERNPSVPVNADEAVKASLPSGSPPTAAPRKSSTSPQRKHSIEQHQPRADDVITPQRPPRLSKNRLRSSWSSSSSSAPPSRASPLVIGGSRRPSLLRDSNSRPESVSPRPPDDPGGSYGGSRVVRKRSNASSRSTKSSIADRHEVTTRHVVELTALPTTELGDLVTTLQREVSSTRAELDEEIQHRKEADLFARELQLQLAKREQAILRDFETKDAIDSKLADLEQELKSAKVLIKDLHHEIEFLQKQLNSYKESADLYKDASEKQEALFKEIVSEKEKQWAEEREKLLLKINEKDVHSLTAQTTAEFAAIQEKLGALHEVLASLNLKADSVHSIERAEEGIARLLSLSTSALRDLQKLSESAEQTSRVLHGIDNSLHAKRYDMGSDRNANNLLEGDANNQLATTASWTQNFGGINQTLERLEANQRVLTDTLEEIQAVLASKMSSGSAPREALDSSYLPSNGHVATAPSATAASADLSDIKEGVGRVLDRLDFYADEIKKASQSEVTNATQKVVEAFAEYHAATKQEMLNLLNKVASSQQKALTTSGVGHLAAKGCRGDEEAFNGSALSDEFAEIRLNQSTALRELQSLKDELIQMDTSGMFARLESCHERGIEQVSRIVEPVSTELKSMQVGEPFQMQHEDLLSRMGEPGNVPSSAQWQEVLHRLDGMLEQTASLRKKDRSGCLRRISADLGENMPDADLTAVLSNLATTLTDLKNEVRRRESLRNEATRTTYTAQAEEQQAANTTSLAKECLLGDAKLAKERYRNKRALLKYKSELKGIKEKLKSLNHAFDRDGFTSHHQIDRHVSELQRKIDLLSLKIESDRHYRMDLEISDLKTEMQQIRQQMAREELLKSTLGFTAQPERLEPEETRPKRLEQNGQQDFLFEKYRSDLSAEISNLQRNLSSEPDLHYSWLSSKKGDTPEEVKKVDVSANKSFPRRKPPSQNQSTPYRVPLFPEHLPSWPMSPVKRTAPPVPTQSAATRQRVQAMLDESFARHMTARNTFVTAPSLEVDGMDAQLKKSLAELTNSLEKTYLV